MTDIVERIALERDRESRLPPEMCGISADEAQEWADEIEQLREALQCMVDGADYYSADLERAKEVLRQKR